MELKDLPGLPAGSRLVLKVPLPSGEYLDDEDRAYITERFLAGWQRGDRVIVLPGWDLFIITPDGKITGTVAAPQEEAAVK